MARGALCGGALQRRAGRRHRCACRVPLARPVPASVAVVCEPARAVGLWVGGELSLFTHALAQLAEVSQGAVDTPSETPSDTPSDTPADTLSDTSSDPASDPQPEAEAPAPTPKAYTPAVLAITGTNGKTTVTSLTGQLVERAGKTVAV